MTKRAYRVEVGKKGCSKCEAGKLWDVVGPDGVALSTSFQEKADAEDLADDMNMAYEAGVAAERAVRRGKR